MSKLPSTRGQSANDSKPKASSSKCTICGFPVREGVQECGACSVIRATSSSIVDEEENVRVIPAHITERRRANRRMMILTSSIAGGILGCILLFFAVSYLIKLGSASKSNLSASDRLTSFVTKTDEFIPIQAFGKVEISGKSAEVELLDPFISKLTDKEKQSAIVSIRNYWFSLCNGTSIKFKRTNGTVVEEFTK